ncbi:glycosyltransferase [Flavobacterium pedocola]
MNTVHHNILFITWDGPQTSYMEGLFMPIFKEVSKTDTADFHVIQFTWADQSKNEKVSEVANHYGIKYTPVKIHRKPNSVLGTFYTLLKGVKFIDNYIKANKISIVMPRSTMPAVMVNRLKLQNCKILFDADGLPLEERVDFAGLSQKSGQYRWLKKEEIKLKIKADGIITRSQKAIEVHLDEIGERYREKFSVVYNGRDVSFFKPSADVGFRETIGIKPDDFVFVYCGSLGPQYSWEEMMLIFEQFHSKRQNSKFLIVSGNDDYAKERIPSSLKKHVIVKKVPFQEVSNYLNCADVAFALRQPTFSMQGVAPIKLGEYLLMGLPSIASKGIGDTETLLQNTPDCYLFDHENQKAVEEAVLFALQSDKKRAEQAIRTAALQYFSLERSAMSYLNAFQKL